MSWCSVEVVPAPNRSFCIYQSLPSLIKLKQVLEFRHVHWICPLISFEGLVIRILPAKHPNSSGGNPEEVVIADNQLKTNS